MAGAQTPSLRTCCCTRARALVNEGPLTPTRWSEKASISRIAVPGGNQHRLAVTFQCKYTRALCIADPGFAYQAIPFPSGWCSRFALDSIQCFRGFRGIDIWFDALMSVIACGALDAIDALLIAAYL
jgi:hypothetical protein